MSVAGVDLDVEALLALRHLAVRLRPPRGAARSNAPGGIVHRKRGRGLELHDIRLWSEGDDIRQLDRNATARTGLPHVRTFQDERERDVLLVADFRPSMLFGTRRALRSIAAGEALAMLGWRIASEGGRVGLLAAAAGEVRRSRTGRGTRAMIAVAGALASAHAAALASLRRDDAPLEALLDEADRIASPGAAIAVATSLDTPGETFAATVERIARRRTVGLLLIADRFERAPPPGAYPFVTPGGGSGWFRIGRERNGAELERRLAALRRLGVHATLVRSDLGPDDVGDALERLGV